MLPEKKLKEAENRVKHFISEGVIKSKRVPEYVDFFIKNADDSIDSAKALWELSTNPQNKNILVLLILMDCYGSLMPAITVCFAWPEHFLNMLELRSRQTFPFMP